jgi:hypothetical protein
MAAAIVKAFGPDPQTPTSSVANAGVRSEKLRGPRNGCDELEKPLVERQPPAQEHASLEELLASSVVRQVMKRDGVHPSDIRQLVASVASRSRHRGTQAAADNLPCPSGSARNLICKELEPQRMCYFDFPPGQRVLRAFTVFCDQDGRWVAAEAHGLPGGVFDSRDEAVRFALWQADRDPTRVHVGPADLARHD